MYLDTLTAEVSQGDIFSSLPLVSAAEGQEQASIERVPAILLTHDCEYDKPSTVSVLIASVPEFYVDLRTMSRVTKAHIAGEAQDGNRLLSLTEEARLALQRQIAGFFGYDR